MRPNLLWILALLAFVGAGGFALRACQQNRIVAAMNDERAMILDCNLGEEGSHLGAYEELHGRMGQHFLFLNVDPAFSSRQEAEAALQGLLAKVTIRDQNQAVAATIQLDLKAPIWDSKGRINCAWRVEPVEVGNYSLELTVIQPAAGLAARAQQLEGRYGPGVSDHYRILIPLGMAQLLSYLGIGLLLFAIGRAIMSWYSQRKQN